MDLETLKTLAQSQKNPTNSPESVEVVVEDKEEVQEEVKETLEDSSLKEEKPEEEIQKEENKEESQPTPTNTQEEAEEAPEEIKSYTQEELDEKLEDAKLDWEEELKKEPKKHSDFLSKIIEAEEKGHNVDNPEYWKYQLEDFDKTAERAKTDKNVGLDMIADAMQIDDPDAPHSELMEELSLRYRDMLSGDYEPEDAEYKKAELAYNRDVRKAARSHKNLQEELKLPQNPKVKFEIEQEELKKQIEIAKPKAEKQFKRKVNKFFENNKSYGFKYGGEEFQYEFSKEELTEFTKGINSIFENVPHLVTPEGLDESLVKEEAFAARLNEMVWNNESVREKLITKAVEHKAAQKLEEDVKERKNTQAPIANGGKVEKAIKSDYQKLAEQMRKINSYR